MRSGCLLPTGIALALFAAAAPACAATTVVLPIGAGPDTVTLSPAWTHRAVDVGLVFDATGSMSGELSNLQTGFNAAILSLQASYPDFRVGVADFEDWPCNGHGLPSAGDLPFRLRQRCTSNTSVAQSGLFGITIRNGVDTPESGYDALFQAITGAGVSAAGCTTVPAFDSTVSFVDGVADGNDGGMGFRGGRATAVLVVVTDADFHEATDYAFSGPASRAGTLAALATSRYRVGAVLSDPTNASARAQLVELSQTSSTVTPPAHGTSATLCETGLFGSGVAPVNGGCPCVFDVQTNGTAATTGLIGAVRNALDASPFTVTSATEGAPVPPGGSTADFVVDAAFTGGTNPAFAPAPTVSGGGAELAGSFATGSADLRIVLENLTVASVDTVQRYPLYMDLFAGGTFVRRDTIVVEIPLLLSVPPGAAGPGLRLLPSSRNPFARRFAAQLALPEAGAVSVTVCDAAGRRVRVLAGGELPAGLHAIEWDGTRDDGSAAPAGVYFVRAAWRDQRASLRVTRLR